MYALLVCVDAALVFGIIDPLSAADVVEPYSMLAFGGLVSLLAVV
jgi:hypothetical protein